jgi:hypothetical protein
VDDRVSKEEMCPQSPKKVPKEEKERGHCASKAVAVGSHESVTKTNRVGVVQTSSTLYNANNHCGTGNKRRTRRPH